MRTALARLLSAALLTAATLACSPSPASAIPSADELSSVGADPIVYVHGFATGPSNWFPWKAEFAADGVPRAQLFSLRYDSNSGNTPSNRVIARQVGDFIRDTVLPATGASRVDIIAHSMGNLSARWCIRFGRCAGVVDSLVSIAGPNHGTTWAAGCRTAYPDDRACSEMIPGSTLLTQLNQGDETPGPVRCTTVRSPADHVVVPSVSAELRGADNRVVTGLNHMGTITDPRVYPIVKRALSG